MLTSSSFGRRFIGFLIAFIYVGPVAAKPRSVTIYLTPVEATSSMPADYERLPQRKELPTAWKKSLPSPFYPRELEALGIEGEVQAEFVVNAHGYVVYAKILAATDERFAREVLLTLSYLRPFRDAPSDPELPARYLLPISFSLKRGSDFRDPNVVAKIKLKKPGRAAFTFSKPFDLNPIYPGLQAAMKLVRSGMTTVEALDVLGEPTLTFETIGGFILGFGPDPEYPEFRVYTQRNIVDRTEVSPPRAATSGK